MTFDEMKDYLNKNIVTLKNLTPSYSKTEEAIDLILQKIEYAMQHDDIETLKPQELNTVQQFLNFYIKGLILLNFKFTEEVAEVSESLALLVDNFFNIYTEKDFFNPTGLIIRTLVRVDQSLQSQIYLNMYLVEKLQDIIDYKKDPLDTRLSRKYYEEYVDFLNRRTDYESSYSPKETLNN